MTRVNVTNTVVERTTVINVYHNNVTNVTYVNQHVNGGVTVVSHDTFVNARPVSRNVVAVPAARTGRRAGRRAVSRRSPFTPVSLAKAVPPRRARRQPCSIGPW